MQNRRCAVCNALNEDNAVYCVNCHSFLHGRAVPGGEHVPIRSVWELDSAAQTAPMQPGAGQNQRPPMGAGQTNAAPGWIAVCPDCQARIRLKDRRMPLCCEACGYLFQLTDQPVREQDLIRRENADQAGKAQPDRGAGPAPEPSVPMRPRKNGPMGRAQADESVLRLISMSNQASFVLTARKEGSILGTQGNMSPDLFRNSPFRAIAPQHLMFWHTETGWYLRPLTGHTIHNGEILNLGVSRKLSDGDLLNVGDCSVRVEIVSQMR